MMALINCPECNKEISDKAESCPHCGCPIVSAKTSITIRFPLGRGQLISNTCYIYYNDKEIALIKSGDYAVIECTKSMELEAKVSGWFGRATVVANPGDKFNIVPRGLKMFFEKVDVITGGRSDSFL